MLESKFINRIAQEVSLREEQVARAIELFEGGATIPFVARYRKDLTGSLDETRLEAIHERAQYFSSLAQRRDSVLDIIDKQGKLTGELRAEIDACFDRTHLEDLYLPFKPTRRTKATAAREKGLEPLADFLMQQLLLEGAIEIFAEKYIDPAKAVSSAEEALEGAGFIVAERISTDAAVRALVRGRMLDEGIIKAHPTKNAEGKKTKFETYYNFSEPIGKIPSHRLLAVMRGLKEGVLRMELVIDDENMMADILKHYLKESGSPFEKYLKEIVRDSYNRLLRPSIENEVLGIARERAEAEAIRVFRENAENLLLLAPAGQITVVGVDPGLRTGCKLAVVDQTGQLREHTTIFPTPPQNDTESAEKTLVEIIDKYNVQAVAIGNGTGSREVSVFVRDVLRRLNRDTIFSVLVNEAGASVYSASKLARAEFPDLDVTIRGAISIARRLQDPLAELVKIDPRHVGVGQYQHDVNQKSLREGLRTTVVSCVNKVGVDLNTASVSLLRYVSGVQSNVAENIVEFRAKNGAFKSRTQLLEVDGIGEKVFEQCAGFLRVANGENVLDATGIHPEAYSVVVRIADTVHLSVDQLLKEPRVLSGLDLMQFADDVIGTHTLADIRRELLKPGRDPRTEFKVPKFLDDVTSVDQLENGMVMEGVVTNVTDFGAFVDIGVHQDGLVHLSELTNRFVQDPRQIVKVGEIVRVKVIKVDKELPRISLSMKALIPPRKKHPRRQRPVTERAAEGGQAPEPLPKQETENRPAPPQREEREQRPRNRRERRPRREQAKAKPGAQTRTGKDAGSNQPLNTQLAEQLAALRAKLR
ncbi:MAG TPA: Tex family protein [Candidatus Hydrogenedentes bacterium]|nr:Tex family protein [Candidatus Hydrogenedentota bacterium]HQM50472.1 Tex family protein [Candidatus Hydrogenedentota bacterium]